MNYVDIPLDFATLRDTRIQEGNLKNSDFNYIKSRYCVKILTSRYFLRNANRLTALLVYELDISRCLNRTVCLS